MKSIVVSAGTRTLMTQAEILSALRHVVVASDAEREHVIRSFLEHCVLRNPEESVLARDAMRFHFWFLLEQYKLERITKECFVASTYPTFVRFCEGVPRESTAEDVKIIRLMSAVLYSTDRDPLARTLPLT